MKTTFICPFNLDRLTGTPLRAKVGINSAVKFAETSVIATGGLSFNNEVHFESIGAWKLWDFSRKTLAKLRQIRPDIVHGITTVSIIPMLLYKFFVHRKAKIIFELHGWAWYETKGRLSFFKRLVFLKLDFWGLWFSDLVIAVSNTEKKFLLRRVFRKSKVITIWDPVDFLPPYKEPEARNVIKVGYIGNAERWQGLPYIIEAARILESNPAIQFQLAGFNSTDDAKFPKLKNIQYIRRVERPDVPPFLADCDILISSRLKEKVSDLQFPHKLSEYMAVARPVIVSSASDQPYVVEHSKSGFVLLEVSGKEIAEKITAFMSLPPDQKIQMGKNAREFCKENLYQDVYAANLKAAYDKLNRAK